MLHVELWVRPVIFSAILYNLTKLMAFLQPAPTCTLQCITTHNDSKKPGKTREIGINANFGNFETTICTNSLFLPIPCCCYIANESSLICAEPAI